MQTSDVIKLYRLAKDDYHFNDDPFDPDPEKVRILKRILDDLPQADRTLLILHIEIPSYRKIGKALGLSHMTVRKNVLRVRNAVLEEYNKQTASK